MWIDFLFFLPIIWNGGSISVRTTNVCMFKIGVTFWVKHQLGLGKPFSNGEFLWDRDKVERFLELEQILYREYFFSRVHDITVEGEKTITLGLDNNKKHERIQVKWVNIDYFIIILATTF